jgi:hypothetical protein
MCGNRVRKLDFGLSVAIDGCNACKLCAISTSYVTAVFNRRVRRIPYFTGG